MYGRDDNKHKNDGGVNDPRPNNRRNSRPDAERIEGRTGNVDRKSGQRSSPNSAKRNAIPRRTKEVMKKENIF